MKLKDRPLEWWKGRLYRYWCRADSKDERKINYTFNWFSYGDGWTVHHFTSDDIKEYYWIIRLREAYVHEVELKDNEWNVIVDYPFYNPHPEMCEAVLKTRKVIS